MCLAIPGKVIEVMQDGDSLALVEVSGVRRKVDLSLLQDEDTHAGDWVLIHVGFAMSKISEADAAEQMRILSILGEEEEALREVRGYGIEEDPSQRGET